MELPFIVYDPGDAIVEAYMKARKRPGNAGNIILKTILELIRQFRGLFMYSFNTLS
jgi:hypothetical protein